MDSNPEKPIHKMTGDSSGVPSCPPTPPPPRPSVSLSPCLPVSLCTLSLLLCWTITLAHLAVLPLVHEDEPWLASAAYKLATQGVYGSDLFAGFYHIEDHYFDFLPLYPWLVAVSFKLFGVGLFQARFVSACLALLTLALTYAVGARLFGRGVGVLAVWLLITIRLRAVMPTLAATGIPLLDLARIVRYDIAVPVFGLAALYLACRRGGETGRQGDRETGKRSADLHAPVGYAIRWRLDYKSSRSDGSANERKGKRSADLHAPVGYAIRRRLDYKSSRSDGSANERKRQGARSIDLVIGILVGLAGLTNLYGLFWGPALAGLWLWRDGWGAWRRLPWVILGVCLVWTPWLVYVASFWADYIGQTRNYADRFDLFAPGFYLHNIFTEPNRYLVGSGLQSLGWNAWSRLGTWLTIIGLPIALLALARHAWQGDWAARSLLAPLVTIQGLFALLLITKTFNYAATLLPLFAMVGAWGLSRLMAILPRVKTPQASLAPAPVGGEKPMEGALSAEGSSSVMLRDEASHPPIGPTGRQWWVRLFAPLRVTKSTVLLLILALTVFLEGVGQWRQMATNAAQTTPYDTYTAQIAAYIPPDSRVLGLHTLWLGLRQYNYRSFTLAFYLSHPVSVETPIPFENALDQIAPTVVLLDPKMRTVFEEVSQPSHPEHGRYGGFWAWMARHKARLQASVDDPAYGRVDVYWLDH